MAADEVDEADRAEEGDEEAAAVATARDEVHDEAADERARDADAGGHEQAHGVAAGEREAGERTDYQAPDEQADQVEKHALSLPLGRRGTRVRSVGAAPRPGE